MQRAGPGLDGRHPDQFFPYLGRTQQLLARMLEIGVPTVAAVTGHAFGLGALLTLSHDVVVMRSGRRYWCLPEIDLGMEFSVGEHALVRRKLSPATRNEAIINGRRWTAEDALAAGIVQEVRPEGEAVDRAIELAAARASKAGPTMHALKRGMDGDVADLLRITED